MSCVLVWGPWVDTGQQEKHAQLRTGASLPKDGDQGGILGQRAGEQGGQVSMGQGSGEQEPGEQVVR